MNYSGAEYACVQGWGIFDGPSDQTMVNGLLSWHVHLLELGLNEDCILGINGVNPAYAGANYMGAIQNFVNLLHANGIYTRLTIYWAAAGTQLATGQPPLLDADHAPAALQVIAQYFGNDQQTLIGLQEEPHDISWACWKNGGSSCSLGYTALGMQSALGDYRAAGGTNVVTAPGIDYANNLQQWLAYKPSDPLNQLMASQDIYGNNTCGNSTCLNAYTGPVAQNVPVLLAEYGETYDGSSCANTSTSDIVGWADAHGVSYGAWTWNTWGACSTLSLISSFNGTIDSGNYPHFVHDHMVALP